MTQFLRQLWVAGRVWILATLVLGLGYPLIVMAFGQAIAHDRANGSLLEHDGVVVGSSLIGQNFTEPNWFHSRPSAAGADGYDAQSSSGSNFGPNNEDLLAAIEERRAAALSEDGPGEVPPDALTASGSGLDPHISVAYAQRQIPRVARVNGLSESQVAQLVDQAGAGRQFGFLGEPRVNVVELNLALFRLLPRH